MDKVDVLIDNCGILTMSEAGFIKRGVIAIKDGRIVYVGEKLKAENLKGETTLKGERKIAMPGLINCHTHVPMTLFRGLAEDKPLQEWLKNVIWPIEAKLKPEDVYFGSLLGCLEMIKGGVTCFADMYFHEDMVAKAVAESGLRGVLAEGIIENENLSLGEETFKRSVNFAEKFNGYADGRVKAFLGPHAVYSCSKDTLKKVRDKAEQLGVGLHIHLAEAKITVEDKSEVEFLDEIGFLSKNVLAAHCINLSNKDMHILSKYKVNVAYNPVANMKFGLELPKIKDLISLGVNVGLGTDGPASNNTLDMFETMKVAALGQKMLYSNAKVLPAFKVLKMATLDGAKALGLEKDIGSIEVGKKADIILLDLSKPHLKPLHDVYASIVYSAKACDVDTVIVDGKILMENRHIKTLDEEAIMKKAEETAFNLTSN